MNILVCVKQVPDTMEVKINPKTNNLDREGIPTVINPYDKHALEEAIRIKEKHGAAITVVSMGPPQTEEILREAIAMGADEAVLLSDKAFAGADTLATTYVLAKAIEKFENKFDIIFCGKEAVDADTGQVGPGLAERLGAAQITFVEKLQVEADGVKAHRNIEDGYEVIEARFPVVLTVTDKLNEPRYPKPINIMKAARKEITVWNSDDLGVSSSEVGQEGSPTIVGRLFTPEPKGHAEMFKGEPEEVCDKLISKLKTEKVI